MSACIQNDPRFEVDANGCWVWQRGKHSAGYGVLWHDGRVQYAHRVYYERSKGPIPAGLQIDHLCRNPACVNPDHLEAVTPAVNSLRGVGVTAQNARKTHCLRGHSLSGDNLYVKPSDGSRRCRACHAALEAARWRRKREASDA